MSKQNQLESRADIIARLYCEGYTQAEAVAAVGLPFSYIDTPHGLLLYIQPPQQAIDAALGTIYRATVAKAERCAA